MLCAPPPLVEVVMVLAALWRLAFRLLAVWTLPARALPAMPSLRPTAKWLLAVRPQSPLPVLLLTTVLVPELLLLLLRVLAPLRLVDLYISMVAGRTFRAPYSLLPIPRA